MENGGGPELRTLSWNLLRLTGRGLDASLETFSVSATPDGTVFIMR